MKYMYNIHRLNPNPMNYGGIITLHSGFMTLEFTISPAYSFFFVSLFSITIEIHL